MSNSNNQTNDIYSISDVEDLSCDTAANIQGGGFATGTLHFDFSTSSKSLSVTPGGSAS